MFRLKSHAATFALVIGLLATFNQTARAESWSWENLFSFESSENAAAVCTTNPVVANVLDSGAGSLRQAVIDACAGGTITFSDAGRGTISLTTGRIVIDKSLTIAGLGADVLTIRNAAGNGNQNHVVYVNGGVTAVLSGLTVSDGYADAGGGISNRGNLTVRNAVITNNHTTGPGGGISSGGTLTLVNSSVTGNGDDNVSQGGGIYFDGSSLIITDSTVSGNYAVEAGGIYADYTSSVTITNSTIGNNVTDDGFGGGGLYLNGGMATLTNCTVSHNQAWGNGGGILIRDGGALTLINSTVANNNLYGGFSGFPFGGGIANGSLLHSGGTVNARNSIIAGNTVQQNSGSGPDFYGTLTSQGYNLIGERRNMTVVGDTTGNIVPVGNGQIDARLGPLASNGGPTQTQVLMIGSPAINTGNTATSPNTDQRGAPRVGTADIGAFELNNSANGGGFVAQLPDGFVQNPYSYEVANFETFIGSTVTGGGF